MNRLAFSLLALPCFAIPAFAQSNPVTSHEFTILAALRFPFTW